MDKKDFDRITKEIFLAYGFVKKRDHYFLLLDEITIDCKLYSWNMVRSFNYGISINGLYDDSVPYGKRYGTYVAIKMEHDPLAEGYHKSEIKYEDYTEAQYSEMLTRMLHLYFDPYKQDALQYVKENYQSLHLKPEGIAYLGIEPDGKDGNIDEATVKRHLDFLCSKYQMKYAFRKFEHSLGAKAALETYSYYNAFGCFTIANEPVRGEVAYYRFDSVDQIPNILLPRLPDPGAFTQHNNKSYTEHHTEYYSKYFNNISKHKLPVFDFEPEIWDKHRKTGIQKFPFSWGTDQQILQALADVIETQIKKGGSFFGIKVL